MGKSTINGHFPLLCWFTKGYPCCCVLWNFELEVLVWQFAASSKPIVPTLPRNRGFQKSQHGNGFLLHSFDGQIVLIHIFDGYPLVNSHITMENHHAINGKTHYFNWAMFNSFLYVCLPGRVNPIDGEKSRVWSPSRNPLNALCTPRSRAFLNRSRSRQAQPGISLLSGWWLCTQD